MTYKTISKTSDYRSSSYDKRVERYHVDFGLRSVVLSTALAYNNNGKRDMSEK
jgi:hypothetical protein